MADSLSCRVPWSEVPLVHGITPFCFSCPPPLESRWDSRPHLSPSPHPFPLTPSIPPHPHPSPSPFNRRRSWSCESLCRGIRARDCSSRNIRRVVAASSRNPFPAIGPPLIKPLFNVYGYYLSLTHSLTHTHARAHAQTRARNGCLPIPMTALYSISSLKPAS